MHARLPGTGPPQADGRREQGAAEPPGSSPGFQRARDAGGDAQRSQLGNGLWPQLGQAPIQAASKRHRKSLVCPVSPQARRLPAVRLVVSEKVPPLQDHAPWRLGGGGVYLLLNEIWGRKLRASYGEPRFPVNCRGSRFNDFPVRECHFVTGSNHSLACFGAAEFDIRPSPCWARRWSQSCVGIVLSRTRAEID